MSGIIAAIAASATLTAIASAVFSAVLSIALSFVAQALFKQPNRGATGTGSDRVYTDNKVTVKQAAAAAQLVYGLARVPGVIGYAKTTGGNKYLHLAILLAGHESHAFHTVCVNEEWFAVGDLDADGFITTGQYANKVRFKFHLGSATQAADADLIAESEGDWTASDRLRGITWMYVRLEWDPKAFVGGIPNLTALFYGKNDIYDPRDASTGYSANAALCAANYLCDATFGPGATISTGVDQTALSAAANSCDEAVTRASGGTENRYVANGVTITSNQPQEILGQLLGSMHGRAPYNGNTWRILAGVYQTPTLTFTDDDLRAGPKVQTLTSRRDLFNAVKGTYFEPVSKFQEVDFPPVVSATYASQDGQAIYKDIQLPFTSTANCAQRIAKIDLLRARSGMIVATMPCKLSAWRCQAGDTINWTSTRYGWSAKPFEVTRAQFTVDRDSGVLGVDLTLVATAPTDYAWSTSEEQVVDAGSITTLPDPLNPLPPNGLSVSEELYVGRDGAGVKTRANLEWAASADAFVDLYQPEFRAVGGTDWTQRARVPGTATTIEDMLPGTYDFRVAAVNSRRGSLSDYTTYRLELTGLLAVPADPSGVNVSTIGGTTLLRWTLAPDLDVRIGGNVVIRHSPASSGAAWDTASPIGDDLPGISTVAVLPAKAGTYLLKFRDSSGLYSASVGTAVVEMAALTAFTTPAGGTLTEDAAFTGAKTHCTVVSSKLKMTAGNATGSYAWSATMDLGSVKNVRVTTNMAVEVINTSDTWDSAEDCDSAESWDVAVSGNEAYAINYVRKTNDDPAGAPTWSAWNRIDSAEYAARAFQFRTDLAATDLNFVVQISALAAVAEEAS